jgi:predicted ester cyclase
MRRSRCTSRARHVRWWRSCSDVNAQPVTRFWTTSWPNDMVNHAAGPQGRAGLRAILRSIEVDLGPSVLEQHHLVVEGDLVAHHVTLHGTHRDSTMPLLADVPVTGRSARRSFFHLWRVEGGMLVEHWAARDDMGLLEQLRS